MATDTDTDPTPPSKHFWLINNQERVLGFPMPAVYHKISKTTVADAQPLTLQPGANVVERRRWEALKVADKKAIQLAKAADADPSPSEIDRYLTNEIPHASHRNREPERAGRRYLIEGPAIGNVQAPLDGIEDDQALAVIAELFDEGLIRRCVGIERRPAVSEALQRALRLVTTGFDGGHRGAA